MNILWPYCLGLTYEYLLRTHVFHANSGKCKGPNFRKLYFQERVYRWDAETIILSGGAKKSGEIFRKWNSEEGNAPIIEYIFRMPRKVPMQVINPSYIRRNLRTLNQFVNFKQKIR